MSNSQKKWIIGGVVIGGIAIIALVMRKKTLANTGPSYTPTAPSPSTPASNDNPSTAPTPQGAIGKKAYVAQPGLIVRSSPELDDGWFGLWGGNDLGAVNGVGTWLGVVTATASDSKKDKNRSTDQPYVWYRLKINPALLLLSSDQYYVREDYINMK